MGCGVSWLLGAPKSNEVRLRERNEEIIKARLQLEDIIREQTQNKAVAEAACRQAVYHANNPTLAATHASMVATHEEHIDALMTAVAESFRMMSPLLRERPCERMASAFSCVPT